MVKQALTTEDIGKTFHREREDCGFDVKIDMDTITRDPHGVLSAHVAADEIPLLLTLVQRMDDALVCTWSDGVVQSIPLCCEAPCTVELPTPTNFSPIAG